MGYWNRFQLAFKNNKAPDCLVKQLIESGLDKQGISEVEADLPYIRAIGKEILRIRPVTTIGTPHYTTADIQ